MQRELERQMSREDVCDDSSELIGGRADKPVEHKRTDSVEVDKFFTATLRHNVGQVKEMLRSKCVGVNDRDSAGCTALHVAARRSRLPGAKPATTEEHELSYFDVIQVLLAEGADVNAVDDAGDTPLHCACVHCHVPTVLMLLEAGANPDIPNQQMETPLFCAVAHAASDIASAFLEAGANPSAGSNHGTPMGEAQRYGLWARGVVDKTAALRALVLVRYVLTVDIRTGQTELVEKMKKALERAAAKPAGGAAASPSTEKQKSKSGFWGKKRIVTYKRSSEEVLRKVAPRSVPSKLGGDAAEKGHRRGSSWSRSLSMTVMGGGGGGGGGAGGGAPEAVAATPPSVPTTLRDLFRTMQHVVVPRKKFLKRGREREEVVEFCGIVEVFLVFAHNKPTGDWENVQSGVNMLPLSYCSWPRVFHQRMKMSLDLLQPKRIAEIRHVVESYLLATEEDSYPRQLAQTLLQFLHFHELDPENALIGLQPAPVLTAEYAPHAAVLLAVKDEMHPHHAVTRSEEDIDFSKRNLDRDFFLQFILATNAKRQEDRDGALDDIAKMSDLIVAENLSSKAWKGRKLRRGDPLIALVSKDTPVPNASLVEDEYDLACPGRFVFARYAGIRTGNGVEIHTTPSEDTTTLVSIGSIFPFTEDMLLKLGNIQHIQSLVSNPIMKLYQRLTNLVRDRMCTLLDGKGVDVQKLKDWVEFNAEVGDLQTIKHVRKQLCDLRDDPPLDFMEEVKQETSDRIATFMATVKMDELFTLSRDKSLKTLLDFDAGEVLRAGLGRYVQYCDSVLDYLKIQTHLLVNGTKKQEITEWWLSLIDLRIRGFLDAIGFDFEALPESYIMVQPDNMDAVRENQRIIQEILKADGSIYPVQQLITDLQSQIYPKIDLFIRNATTALAESLDIAVHEFSLEVAEKRFEELRGGGELSGEKEDLLDDLMKDIVYLTKVKEMEENPTNEGSFSDNLNIVPMSGIIMGTFYRHENELNTAIELWDGRFEEVAEPVADAAVSSPSSTPPISPREESRTSAADCGALSAGEEGESPEAAQPSTEPAGAERRELASCGSFRSSSVGSTVDRSKRSSVWAPLTSGSLGFMDGRDKKGSAGSPLWSTRTFRSSTDFMRIGSQRLSVVLSEDPVKGGLSCSDPTALQSGEPLENAGGSTEVGESSNGRKRTAKGDREEETTPACNGSGTAEDVGREADEGTPVRHGMGEAADVAGNGDQPKGEGDEVKGGATEGSPSTTGTGKSTGSDEEMTSTNEALGERCGDGARDACIEVEELCESSFPIEEVMLMPPGRETVLSGGGAHQDRVVGAEAGEAASGSETGDCS